MTRTVSPAGDPGPYFQGAFVCILAVCAIVAVALIDASDGETRMRRSGIVRLADDPVGFRGALIMKYGMFGIGALVGSFACAMGGMGVRHANRTMKS